MDTATINFEERLKANFSEFARVVPFEPGDKLLVMDFTEKNDELTDEILSDTNLFIKYINAKLSKAGAKYGIGGYGENRTIYRRSEIFSPSRPSRWEGHQQHRAWLSDQAVNNSDNPEDK